MTTTEVLNQFAQKFGQDPMLRPHGKYQCGGCGGWFGVGEVSVLLGPGGGQFQCIGCSVGAEQKKMAAAGEKTMNRVSRNAEICRRVGAGEPVKAVVMDFGISTMQGYRIVKKGRAAS